MLRTFLMILGVWLAVISAAYAEPVSVEGKACALHSQSDLSVHETFNRRADFECTQKGFVKTGAHYWILMDVPEPVKTFEDPVWRIGIARYEAVDAHVLYSDGTISTRSYSTQDLKENWRSLSAFAIPIEARSDAVPQSVLLSVENVWDAWNLEQMQILSAAEEARMHQKAQLMNVAFSALLFGLFVLSLVIYFILRVRFVLFHATLVASWIIIQLLLGGFVFEILPALSLTSRSILVHMMLALNISMVCLLARDLCEAVKLGKGGRAAFTVAAVFAPSSVIGMFALDSITGMQISSASLFFALCLISTAIMLVAGGRAILRGSRILLVTTLGTSGFIILLVCYTVIPFGILPESMDFELGMYAAVLFEALVYSCIVASKAMSLRRQHDMTVLENSLLFKQASTDDLTGLLNRRAFVDGFESAMNKETVRQESWTLLAIDIDHFKSVNDTFGHDAGDKCLQQVAELLKEMFYDDNICARLGGEEFATLFKAETQAEAEKIAESLRAKMAAYIFGTDTQKIGRVTLSIGLMHIPKQAGYTFDIAYKAADAALYAAKANGRNRVEIADLKRTFHTNTAKQDLGASTA